MDQWTIFHTFVRHYQRVLHFSPGFRLMSTRIGGQRRGMAKKKKRSEGPVQYIGRVSDQTALIGETLDG
jgi:hypothetical protein